MGLNELVFDVTYEAGIDPVADVFIEHSGLLSRSLTCTVTAEDVWYLEQFTGPTAALDDLDDVLDELTVCGSEIEGEHQYENWQYKLLSRTPSSRTICAYGTHLDTNHSIPHLAATHIDTGLLYETERRGSRCRWRILMPQDVPAKELYTTIQEALPSGLEMRFDHVRDPSHWGDDTVSLTDLPYEQREALEAAVAHGYYETPREITAQELADRLNLPQSTLQYRLSRAEAWLATRFVADITPDQHSHDSAEPEGTRSTEQPIEESQMD